MSEGDVHGDESAGSDPNEVSESMEHQMEEPSAENDAASAGAHAQSGTIREIGHLFLSSIREKAGVEDGGAPFIRKPPVRVPPAPLKLPAILGGVEESPRQLHASDLVEHGRPASTSRENESKPNRVHLVVAAECDGSRRLVESFARYLSAGVGSGAGVGDVGLLWVERSRVRLVAVGECAGGEMREADLASAVANLNKRAKQWVVAVVPGRLTDLDVVGMTTARILAAGDDESVVAAYRCAKAVAADNRLGAHCEIVAEVMASKRTAEGVVLRLEAASRQHIAESVKGGAIVAGSGFYDVGARMAEVAIAAAVPSGIMQLIRGEVVEDIRPQESVGLQKQAEDKQSLIADTAPEVSHGSPRVASDSARSDSGQGVEERVIELSGNAVEALAADGQWGLKMLPVRVPHLAEARLAVDGMGRVALLAEVSGGAEGLERLGQAYGWVCDSRELIAMVANTATAGGGATAAAQPHLYLLVKGSSRVGAMLARSNVTVVGYRVVRWGEKRGMLLAA